MSVFVHHIACRVPAHAYDQRIIGQRIKQWLAPDRRTARLIDRLYRESGIQTRYSVLPDTGAALGLAADGPCRDTAGTGSRNRLYTESARELYVDVCRQLFEEADGGPVRPDQVTHLVTVSCTGFFNPGPDYEIIRRLSLRPTVQRFHIGFMGCYAAFPALRLARSICQADPEARVLIAAVELCSLHLRVREDIDTLLGGALFADGAAAVLVSRQPPEEDRAAFRLDHFATALLPDSDTDMAWTIGDRGFEMTLSPQVPRLIEAHLLETLCPVLHRWDQSVSTIRHWAVHPGGKAILDRIKNALLLEDALDTSRAVLRDFGNMSSVTILFVLQALLRQPSRHRLEPVLALAFGPGLTMEMGLLQRQAPCRPDASTAVDDSVSENRPVVEEALR